MAFLLLVGAILLQLGYGIFGERPTKGQKRQIQASRDLREGKIAEKEYWDIWDEEITRFINKPRL